MKTQEKIQSFLLPFFGGILGILSGYIYSLNHNSENYSVLVVGCIIGVVIGAFATKLVKVKFPEFLSKEKAKISVTQKIFRKINRVRKVYLLSVITIPFVLYLSFLAIIYMKGIFYPLLSIKVEDIIWVAIFFISCLYAVFFVVIPVHILKENCKNRGLEDFVFPKHNRKRLVNFWRNKTKFFLGALKEVLLATFVFSIAVVCPAILVLVFVCIIGSATFCIWLIFIVAYGIARGIFALLGKTIFWSSLIVSILVVLHSWNQFSLFISNPLFAICLALATGIFAGVLHRFIFYPLCRFISKSMGLFENKFELKKYELGFFGLTFDKFVKVPTYFPLNFFDFYFNSINSDF